MCTQGVLKTMLKTQVFIDTKTMLFARENPVLDGLWGPWYILLYIIMQHKKNMSMLIIVTSGLSFVTSASVWCRERERRTNKKTSFHGPSKSVYLNYKYIYI